MNENKLKRIYLDLDGVLVDWLTAAVKACGLDPKDPQVAQYVTGVYGDLDKLVTEKQLLEGVEALGTDFWVNLEFFPWGQKLVQIAVDTVGLENTVFLTKCGKFMSAPTGKYLWWKKYYPKHKIVLAADKYLLAKPDCILIDDDPRQIERFKEAGGLTWQWTRQKELLSSGIRWREELGALQLHLKELSK